MYDWWSYKTNDPFTTFGTVHLWTIAVFLLGLVAIYLFRHRLQEERANRVMRYILIFGLIIGETYWYIWKGPQLGLTIADDLPLQLCSITEFIAIYLLITRKNFLFDFLYYFGIAGAAIAILTPDLDHTFPHFRFLGYMIGHASIVYTCFFLIWVEKWRPSTMSLIWALVGINLLFFFIYPLDLLTGGNYMYLLHKPSAPTPLDYMGPYPWYILSLEGVVIVLCILMYLPFWKKNRNAESKRIRI